MVNHPPTLARKSGSSVGTRTRCVHVFFCTFGRPIRMLSRCLVTKFLRRSSGGSLLRARCWSGSQHVQTCPFYTLPFPSPPPPPPTPQHYWKVLPAQSKDPVEHVRDLCPGVEPRLEQLPHLGHEKIAKHETVQWAGGSQPVTVRMWGANDVRVAFQLGSCGSQEGGLTHTQQNGRWDTPAGPKLLGSPAKTSHQTRAK